jgi:hypothetical protein
MDIHFLHCVHGNNRKKTHDVVHDTFALLCTMLAFMWDENNYMHFPSNMFNSSRRQVNIVPIKDGIHTLINIVIVDPT